MSLALGIAAQPAPWPMPHRDAQRSGYAPRMAEGSFTRKWYRAFYDEVISTSAEAIVAEGKVFIGTYAGRLYALDVRSGATVWQFQAGGPIGNSPVYHGGRILFGAADGVLYCLRAGDGTRLWRYDAGAGMMNSPVCDGKSVYIGDRAGVLHAVALADGARRWSFRAGAMILKPASITADGERIVFAAEDMHVYCLDPRGRLIWKSAKMAGLSTRGQGPTLCGGVAIVRSNPGQFFHSALWIARDLLGRATQPPKFKTWDEEAAAILAYLRAHPEDQTFYAFSLSDGREAWRAPILYTGGCQTVATPPTFNPRTGEMFTLLPTRVGAWTSGVSQVSVGLGKIDPATGALRVLPSPAGWGKEVGYHNTAAIADETTALSLLGDVLLLTHQGGILGRRLPDLRQPFNVLMARDSYGGIYGPAAWRGDIWKEAVAKAREGWRLGAVNEWHGPDRAVASTDGERLFWVSGSQVICLGGPGIPASEEYNRVQAVKRTAPSFVSGGNVNMGVGGFDAGVERIELTPEDLRGIIARVPKVKRRSEEAAARTLRTKLDAEVRELVEGGPWRPFTVELGISGEEWHFWRAAKNITAVSLALPHLSDEVKEMAIRWLDEQVAAGRPLERPVLPMEGKEREFYDLHPATAERRADKLQWTANIEDVYALWAYAHYAGRWERVAAQIPRVRAMMEDFKPKPFDHGDLNGDAAEHLNARIAGLIGAARILEHAGDAAGAAQAETKLAPLAAERIHHERADSLLLRGTRECTRIHDSKIPRYVELYPEVALLLREHAGAALETHVRALMRELPLWNQAWCERMIGGEVFSSTPTLMRGLAAAACDGLRLPAEEAARYADAHWCRADIYFIEKLSAMLRLFDGAW